MGKAVKTNAVVAELDRYLAEADLTGADAVRAALARKLAVAIDETPAYALPRLAAALTRLLDGLGGPSNEDAGRAAARLVRQVVG